MALIGGIDIALRAQTEKLDKGLKSASNTIGKFASNLNSIGGAAVTSGMGALAVVAAGAAAALGALSIKSAKEIDEVNDLGQRIGLTAQSMRELQYATQLTGSEAEDLGPALLKMNANLSDAARAGGPVADSLKRIGLSAKDLVGKSPDQAFLKISGAISRLSNTSDQAATAMDIFGKTGVQLLNTINAGPAELERLTHEFQDLRGEISQDDANTIGAMFDSFDSLGQVIGGVGDRIAIEFAPYVTEVIDLVVDLGSNALKTGGILDTAFNAVGSALEFVDISVRNFSDLWEIAGIKAEEVVTNIGLTLATLPSNLKIIGDYIAGNWRELISDAVQAVGKVFANLGDNLGRLAFEIKEFLSGRGFNFEWKGLLDGFEATAAEFPKLLMPELVSMQGEIDAVGKRIADREQKRRDEMEAMEPASKKIDTTDLLKDKAKKEKLNAGAFQLGSKEAYSAIVKYQAGGKDTATKIAGESLKVQQETLKEMKKTNAARMASTTNADLYKLPA